MTDYNEIPDAIVGVDDPLTANTVQILRNNPIAISEGASGAPRIQFAAMDAWYSTEGAVGSLALLAQLNATGTQIVAGTTYAGSGLTYAGLHFTDTTLGNVGGSAPGAALSGTWKALGSVTYSATDTRRVTLFIRVA